MGLGGFGLSRLSGGGIGSRIRRNWERALEAHLLARQPNKVIDHHWSNRSALRERPQLPQIKTHVSKRICGIPTARAGKGLLIELQRRYPEGFERAISVGAGQAAAEMDLLRAGIVEHFDIFELASGRIKTAREQAERLGLERRITFHNSDVFLQRHQRYDLVYWRNSLHHMSDTRAAVYWSKEHLSRNGVFAMQEYTGPNRLQYTPRQMEICDHALSIVPDSYFMSNGCAINRKSVPPCAKALARRDPSEAPDSESIMSALADAFPEASLINVGGLVYFAGMRRIIRNLSDTRDSELIMRLLDIDADLANQGESLFHVAIAQNSQ